jgi:hypothetical protein
VVATESLDGDLSGSDDRLDAGKPRTFSELRPCFIASHHAIMGDIKTLCDVP